VNHTIFNK